MFSPSDRSKFRNAVQERVSDSSDMRDILDNLDINLWDIVSNNANLKDIIFEVTDKANKQGWMPELIDVLIADFHKAESFVEDLIVLKGNYLSQRSASDPFKTTKVGNNQPYVNRSSVEDAFRSLGIRGTGIGNRVLIVNGPEHSGKSYLANFAKYVADVSEDPNLVLTHIDLSERIYANALTDLIKNILILWRKNPDIPKQYTQSTSSSSDLAFWICSQAPSKFDSNSGPDTWIVIDGLAEIPQDQRLTGFISRLRSILLSNSDMRIRIILLDIGSSMQLGKAHSHETRIEISPINKKELVTYFKQVCSSKEVEGPDEDEFAEVAEQILKNWSTGIQTEGMNPHELIQVHIDKFGSKE